MNTLVNMRKVKCRVCKSKIEPMKHKIYTVKSGTSFIDSFTTCPLYFDVIDCPACGCQTILSERLTAVENVNPVIDYDSIKSSLKYRTK